jgi:hypothetical protein
MLNKSRIICQLTVLASKDWNSASRVRYPGLNICAIVIPSEATQMIKQG